MEMNVDAVEESNGAVEEAGVTAEGDGNGTGQVGDEGDPTANAAGGHNESDEDQDGQDDQELMDESDEDEEGYENGTMLSPSPSPSVKTGISTSDNESDVSSVSDSRSVEASPAKRRRPNDNPNMMKGLKHYQQLKRTKEPFQQDKSCQKLLKKKKVKQNKKTIKKIGISMCIDCKTEQNPNTPRKVKDAPICRFYHFRRLFYPHPTTMKVSGFPNSSSGYDASDKRLWMPEDPPETTSLELAKFLLQEVGDQFCDLVKQENGTLEMMGDQENKTVIWRRVVKDLRELCDVCSTTLFNFHWTCGKCGFVVCISCFKARKQDDSVPERVSTKAAEKDEFGWPKCHRHIGQHELENLMATQIIAGDALNELSVQLHELRSKLGITQGCGCKILFNSDSASIASSSLANERTHQQLENGDNSTDVHDDPINSKSNSVREQEGELDLPTANGLSNPACEANKDSDKENDDDDDNLMGLMLGAPNDSVGNSEGAENGAADDDEDDDDDDDLMSLMVGESNENNGSAEANAVSELKESDLTVTEKCTSSVESKPKNDGEMVLKNFIRKGKGGESSTYVIKVLPKKLISSYESSRRYPDVPHSWLCYGHLLRLEEPTNSGNLKMFQEQWKRGQPVLVSNVASNLDKELWSPDSFSRDFGEKKNPLINCITGKVLQDKKIKVFWDGFEHMDKRLKDKNGVPMLLKLKDWPPGEDFKDICPVRFEDLMKALPLGEYTHRDGDLNLAARLPKIFSRPDLGPKMYIAYGSGLYLDKGTTNVHLDVSDAVNVMVHVGEVQDADITEHREAVMKAIEESDCDIITTNRVLKNQELPGALWHIWEARDADKIRDLINKVNFEKGVKVEPHHDAIHDQSIYLDRNLRRRLMEEYNVMGYPILQCAGDAVFVPAGAPHQVRNLNNCIKIAEDFVSPENVGHCFYLTEEFRNLTETHTNHEDKLQIKNIVYHTVKDAIAVINASLKPNRSASQ